MVRGKVTSAWPVALVPMEVGVRLDMQAVDVLVCKGLSAIGKVTGELYVLLAKVLHCLALQSASPSALGKGTGYDALNVVHRRVVHQTRVLFEDLQTVTTLKVILLAVHQVEVLIQFTSGKTFV